VPAYLLVEYVPPHASPSQTVKDAVSQECGVYAVEMELASQISISAQQAPWPPTPVFALLEDGTQPTTLACNLMGQRCFKSRVVQLTSPPMNLRSRGH
jgi:hypothetical protein